MAVAAAILVLASRGAAARPVREADSPEAAEPSLPLVLGLVHVDLMDLHLIRRPEGGVLPREVLSAEEIADRYGQAASSGAGWNRWSLYWDMVQAPGGDLAWTVPDGIAGRDAAAGLRTLAILQGTPADRADPVALAACRVEASKARARPAPARAEREIGRAAAASLPCRSLAAPPLGLEAPAFLDSLGAATDSPHLASTVNPANPWAAFVDQAVRRYRPGGDLARRMAWPVGVGVSHWEVGNEPNLRHFWSGSAAQYVRYLQVAAAVIHWRDPAATVVHGGIADDAAAGDWYRAFLQAWRARAAATGLDPARDLPFDAAGWHWYVYPGLLQTGPERARGYLEGAGLPRRPIWVTELGIPVWNEHPGPCWDPASPWRATAGEQSAYVWQAYGEGLAQSVAALFFFQLYDDCGNGPASYDAFGLVRNHGANQCWTVPSDRPCWVRDIALDGRPRPAREAIGAWATELAGAELLWRPPREANQTQRILFYRPPAERVTLAWNHQRATQSLEFFATGPKGRLLQMDASGAIARADLKPSGGRYRLDLAGATNRNNPGNQAAVLAGAPQLLVETDTAAPFRAQIEALPERSPASFTLRARAADGGTGVGQVKLWSAVQSGEAGPCDPQSLTPGPAQDWPGDPLADELLIPAGGAPGERLCFALSAADRAGNWNPPPVAAQAWTVVDGIAISPTPGPPPTASPSPTRPPGLRPAAYLPALQSSAAGRAPSAPGSTRSMRRPGQTNCVPAGACSTSARASFRARVNVSREAAPP